MTDPPNDNDPSKLQCSVCEQFGGPFSNRQLKRAQKEQTVKCRKCSEEPEMDDDDVVVYMDETEKAPIEDAPEEDEDFLDEARKTDEPIEDAPEEDEEYEEAAKAQFSDDEGEAKAQFSEDEDETAEAQFSDAEMPDTNKTMAVPRKRKAPPTASASLISNVQAAKPTQPAPGLQTTAQDEADFRDSDDDSEEEVNLSALKQTIMGRKIQTAEDVEDEERKPPAQLYTTDCQISHQLRKELACAICHECFLHPCTLLCGHSFCKECIQWWWTSSSVTANTKSCPTCRQEIPARNAKSLGVNTALRACVLALLGNEVQIRMEAAQQSRKGENEGAHKGGYEVLVDASADSWKTPGISWSCRRAVVLDAEDQRMQLALGIWKDATQSGVHYNPRDQTLQVSLCVLQMEEDEVADGGFPRVVHEDDEEDNDQLLVSRSGGRFVHSMVRATAQNGETKIPLGRRGIPASGIVEFSLELTNPQVTSAEFISFEHEETGAILDLKVPANLNSGGAEARNPPRRQPSGRTASTALELEEDYEEEAQRKAAYDSEDDGSHMDRYEDDGFIADEADEEEELHEDDCCQVCKEGGDLMICDGGDNIEGCARSFHANCVNRKEVPRGDWICQDCASQLELGVGIEGHEFPMEGFCEVCESDGVDLVCDGGDHVKTCGKKYHISCLDREEFPKGDWICEVCALSVGKKAGPEGYEFPEGDEEDDAIEIDDSEPESPPPRKKQKGNIDPDDVIDLGDDDDDESEAAEFDSPAKGGRHIGGDSDDEDADADDDEDDEEEPLARSKKPKARNNRVVLMDDDDDDE